MNKTILVGRLTRDPDVRYAQGENPMCIARYTLAVDRPYAKKSANADQPTADFISVVAFGRDGEFAEKWLRKGRRILVEGHIQTGNYTNKDGQKVYTTDVVVDRHEFVDSNPNAQQQGQGQAQGGNVAQYAQQPQQQYAAPQPQQGVPAPAPSDGFMNIPDGIDEELPFS